MVQLQKMSILVLVCFSCHWIQAMCVSKLVHRSRPILANPRVSQLRKRYATAVRFAKRRSEPDMANPLIQRDTIIVSVVGVLILTSLGLYIAQSHSQYTRIAYKPDLFDQEMAILRRYRDDATLPRYITSYVEQHFHAMCTHPDGQEILRAFADSKHGAACLHALADDHTRYLHQSRFGRELLLKLEFVSR